MKTDQVVADILKHIRATGWQPRDFEAQAIANAVSAEFKRIFENRERCRRCYAEQRDTGQVVTVSPRVNAFFVWPVCLNDIQKIEEWIRGESRRFGKPRKDAAQKDLSEALGGG